LRTLKANITLKLDVELLREGRILAAPEGTSVSALLATKLKRMVRERKAYDRSKRRALARLGEGFDLNWKSPRSPDQPRER